MALMLRIIALCARHISRATAITTLSNLERSGFGCQNWEGGCTNAFGLGFCWRWDEVEGLVCPWFRHDELAAIQFFLGVKL